MPTGAGRVLIIGGAASPLAERLAARGYVCETAAGLREVGSEVQPPDAVVLTGTPRSAGAALRAVRRHSALRTVPVLVDGSGAAVGAFGRLGADGVAETLDELERHLAASVRARRLTEREELVRRRLELLLDIARVASSPARAGELVPLVTSRLRAALGADQALALSVEGEGPRKAWLVDDATRVLVDLAVSPMLRRALETQEPVTGDGVWVHPLKGEPDGITALVVRRRAPLDQEERDLLSAVALAIGRAAEQGQAHASVERARQTLEAAYIDRYRELHDANERLKALDRKKNELLAVLSHDLRAPLNVAIGHAHLLLTDGALPEGLRPSAEAIQRTSKKILELVENLLERTRAEDGHIVLFTKTMDVSETCQEAVGDLQILARQRGVALRVEAPLSLLVLGDEQKIRQVLQNLVTNALTHAKGATTVMVRAQLKQRPDGDVALVEVRDNGRLDDPQGLLLAFDKATGLGLGICRDYVERHGGEIWAESPKEGGALFAFTLPIKRESAPTTQAKTDVPLVLLADSDPSLARMSAMGLSGHYRVELARDGHEVVRKAAALHPDMVVMSVFLPGRDGLDALRELNSRPETSRIPVVLVAGSQDLSDRIRGLDLGSAELLTRPFPLSTLLTRVGETLQRTHVRTVGSVGTDQETGLLDHLGVVNRLDQELSRTVRYGRPLTLAVLRPSSSPRDARSLAAVVRRELRVPDVAAHLGGGLFVAILPETTQDAAGPLAARLRNRLAKGGVPYTVTLLDVRDGAHGGERVLEQALT